MRTQYLLVAAMTLLLLLLLFLCDPLLLLLLLLLYENTPEDISENEQIKHTQRGSAPWPPPRPLPALLQSPTRGPAAPPPAGLCSHSY